MVSVAKGDVFKAEWKTVRDLVTGVESVQLTEHKAHSHHMYFTNNGWYDHDCKLLIGSDRGNATNLYGVALDSGEIRQLTDIDDSPGSGSGAFQSTCVNPTRDEAYFWSKQRLIALDLDSLDERVLYQVPKGFKGGGQTNVTADGRYVCVNVNEDLSHRFTMDLGAGYVGMHEYWDAHPNSRVVRVSTDNGDADIVWEENSWVGHVNTSSTRPELLTFCHEGPWYKVDHRIWMLDLSSGDVWKLRPTAPKERVGDRKSVV